MVTPDSVDLVWCVADSRRDRRVIHLADVERWRRGEDEGLNAALGHVPVDSSLPLEDAGPALCGATVVDVRRLLKRERRALMRLPACPRCQAADADEAPL